MGVQVEQQRDLGAVVQHLAVDVQHEGGHRLVGVRALGRAARPGQPGGVELADAGDPRVVVPVEQRQAARRRQRPVGRLVATPPSPKWLAARSPKTPIAMWPMRQAIVVIGGGDGSGSAKSMTASPAPTAIGGRRLGAPPDAPQPWHRLPAVLLVGQRVEAGPQDVAPVELELVDELMGPIDVGMARPYGAMRTDTVLVRAIICVVVEDPAELTTTARLLALLSLLQARPHWSGPSWPTASA